jgi:uncharacterized membrane protein AbrB (regulator of aidB expression)
LMQCRSCGAEIADKAIVCYRCGAATTDPVRKASAVKPSRSPLPSYLVAAVMLLIALYVGYISKTTANPDRWQAAAGVLTGAAAMVIVLALVRRRRKR